MDAIAGSFANDKAHQSARAHSTGELHGSEDELVCRKRSCARLAKRRKARSSSQHTSPHGSLAARSESECASAETSPSPICPSFRIPRREVRSYTRFGRRDPPPTHSYCTCPAAACKRVVPPRLSRDAARREGQLAYQVFVHQAEILSSSARFIRHAHAHVQPGFAVCSLPAAAAELARAGT